MFNVHTNVLTNFYNVRYIFSIDMAFIELNYIEYKEYWLIRQHRKY